MENSNYTRNVAKLFSPILSILTDTITRLEARVNELAEGQKSGAQELKVGLTALEARIKQLEACEKVGLTLIATPPANVSLAMEEQMRKEAEAIVQLKPLWIKCDCNQWANEKCFRAGHFSWCLEHASLKLDEKCIEFRSNSRSMKKMSECRFIRVGGNNRTWVSVGV